MVRGSSDMVVMTWYAGQIRAAGLFWVIWFSARASPSWWAVPERESCVGGDGGRGGGRADGSSGMAECLR